jgi:formate C-acetyltransferase/4-hydroxyphenylacetate decarboxylase large subunit
VADGVTSPHPGTDRGGPAAVLRSAQKVDHSRIRGGLLNLKFHPSALRGVDGSRKLLQLIRTLFETQTAFQVQFNVVDSRMLREAQARPGDFRDLIVRVAGFSAYFVELQKSVQDQVIERTEHAL